MILQSHFPVCCPGAIRGVVVVSTFLTDLDNTLIYSHKRDIGEKKTVVEYLNGRQQSFMTDYTYSFLKASDWLDIVPVTTRTSSQFRRITFIEELSIKNAIVFNGGMLLVDNTEDKNWSEDTFAIAEKNIEALNKAENILRNNYAAEAIHRPIPYMLYLKCDSPSTTCQEIARLLDKREVIAQHNHRKVYLFCAGVDKGNAAFRYENKMKIEIDVAAGDDVMDIPMLEYARFAFASRRIAPLIKNKNIVIFDGELISDSICNELQRLHDLGEI